jgi:hypothetical protein
VGVPPVIRLSGTLGVRGASRLSSARFTRPGCGGAAVSISKPLLFCLVLALASRTAGAQPPPAARVLGTVSDASGGVLPGVTVVVRAGGRDLTTVTSAAGRYEFTALPAGRYALAARLQGFREYTREIELQPGEIVTLDFRLCVGGMRFIDWFAPAKDLAELQSNADVVAYVRVLTNDGRSGDCASDAAKLTVKVLDLVKPVGIEDGSLAFWQELWYEEPAPYPVGAEYVVFLQKWKDRYIRISGPMTAFPVAEGKLQAFKFNYYRAAAGMPVQAFLAQLREQR